MPTNEQIVEAARRKTKPLSVRTHESLMREQNQIKYTVIFSAHVTVTPEEAESIALEPKQEHDHETCAECSQIRFECKQAGKASVPRLEPNVVYQLLLKNLGRPIEKSVAAICAEFAATEPKHDHADCHFCNSKIAEAFEFGIKCAKQKQLHDHNVGTCDKCRERSEIHCDGEGCSICHDRYLGAREIGFEAGKDSIPRLDRDALIPFLKDKGWSQPHELAEDICAHFAASEHEHDNCDECTRRSNVRCKDDFEAGKASLPRFERDAVADAIAKYIAEHSSYTAHDLADAICASFAAPERTTCTFEQAKKILNDSDIVGSETICRKLQASINEVLALPAREKAERIDPKDYQAYLDRNSIPHDKQEQIVRENGIYIASTVNQYLLEKLYSKQPAPEETEPTCPTCGHDNLWIASPLPEVCSDAFHRERGAA